MPLVVTAQTTGGVALSGVAVTVTWNSTIWGQGQTGQDGSSIFYLDRTNGTYPIYNLTASSPTGFTPASKTLLFTLNSTGNHISVTFSPPQPQITVLVLKALDQDGNALGDVALTVTKAQLVVAEGKTNSSATSKLL